MSPAGAIKAIDDRAVARLRYGTGDGTHATGRVIAFCDAPTICILTEQGERIWWRADLAEIEGER